MSIVLSLVTWAGTVVGPLFVPSMAVVKGTANSYICHPSEPKTLKPQDKVTELCRSSLHNPVSSNFVAGSKDKVALPIVAVWVKGRGLNNYMNTYALIDPGGTSGYCSEELAKKLGVPRKSYTCDLPTIHQGNTPVTADFVNLQVSNVNGRPQFDTMRPEGFECLE